MSWGFEAGREPYDCLDRFGLFLGFDCSARFRATTSISSSRFRCRSSSFSIFSGQSKLSRLINRSTMCLNHRRTERGCCGLTIFVIPASYPRQPSLRRHQSLPKLARIDSINIPPRGGGISPSSAATTGWTTLMAFSCSLGCGAHDHPWPNTTLVATSAAVPAGIRTADFLCHLLATRDASGCEPAGRALHSCSQGSIKALGAANAAGYVAHHGSLQKFQNRGAHIRKQ